MSAAKDLKARKYAQRRREDAAAAGQLSGSAGAAATTQGENVCSDYDLSALLLTFACRDDGWLRFMPDSDSERLNLKWKFTTGRFSGFYCFVGGPSYEYKRLLNALHDFIEACYDGTRKPTLDRYYNR